MGDGQPVSFRSHAASDFEAVADLWTRVNWELAPVGMGALFAHQDHKPKRSHGTLPLQKRSIELFRGVRCR